jgi:hypothetical protein
LRKLTNIKGIKGNILPLSQAPPTAIAHTVAWKTNWKKLNNTAGMVPTGSARTFLWKAYLKSPKTAPPSPYVKVYPIRNHCIEQMITAKIAGMIAARELDRVV